MQRRRRKAGHLLKGSLLEGEVIRWVIGAVWFALVSSIAMLGKGSKRGTIRGY